eukprot:6279278-Amphidinium_carterae.3
MFKLFRVMLVFRELRVLLRCVGSSFRSPLMPQDSEHNVVRDEVLVQRPVSGKFLGGRSIGLGCGC